MAALVAVWLECFRTYTLAPGERGVVMVIAGDRRQACVIVRYVVALLEGVPMLERLIATWTVATGSRSRRARPASAHSADVVALPSDPVETQNPSESE